MPDNFDPYSNFPGSPVAPAVTVGETRPHSGLGITSFVCSMISLIGIIGLVIAAAGIAASGPKAAGDSTTTALGAAALILMLFNILGVVFGIVGLVQGGRRKLFAVLGLSINGALLLIFGGLMALGAAVS